MSDLHDLIMALPEGATLEITRGEIEDSVVVSLEIDHRGGVRSGTDLVLAARRVANTAVATAALDGKARMILNDARFKAASA